MAKREVKGTAAPAAVVETETAIVPAAPQAIARPTWVSATAAEESTQGIESNDVSIPRLAIAQALNPQLKRTDPAYIEGLAQLDMFNTVTSENYGAGPLSFSPLLFRKRAIEFIPRTEGGGVRDANVSVAVDPVTGAYKDKRLNFGPNGEAPTATLFHEWICVLLDTMSLIAISMKTSQLKVSKALNYIVREDATMRKLPAFARAWTIRTVEQTNRKGTFGNYVVRNGAVHGDAMGSQLAEIFESLKGKNLTVNDPTSDDEPAGGGGEPGSDNVPF